MKNFVIAFCLSTFSFCLSVKAQWSRDLYPGFRDGNSVVIIDDQMAAIGGGHLTNDSIRDVLVTRDRTQTWEIRLDAIRPWLRSICFVNPYYGYGVGDQGTIIRSKDGGFVWDTIVAPGNTAGRYFTAVCFLDTNLGYVAGGNQSNDSIQTILKTTDGGNTWSIQRDIPGPWLRSLFFVDASIGFAAGDKGTILKTTNGGNTLNTLKLPGNLGTRQYNSIYFLNANTGFAVGGNPTNDSIQTIIKTNDGGNNWSVIADNLGAMLNSIDFATGNIAYAVGQVGTMLQSTDTGNTWLPVTLPNGVADVIDFNSVNFLNADFGLAVGKSGYIVKYIATTPTVPTVTTLQATRITANSAQLNAWVNANGSATSVWFEYGLTPSLGNSINISGVVTGNSVYADSVLLTGLLPNSFYYYRVKGANSNGISTGALKQFYTSDCEIPNCDFEMWDTMVINQPIGWHAQGKVQNVTSYNGSHAAEMSGGNVSDGGAVILADVSESGLPQGGIPFAARPDSIVFHARYDVMPGDSAFCVMFFKRNGHIFSQAFFPITGSSGGNFVLMKYAIQYADTIMPDSLMMAFLSSSIISHRGNPISKLAVDDVSFTGTNLNVPNHDFEQFDSLIDQRATGWWTDVYGKFQSPLRYFDRTADRISGHSAVILRTRPGGGNSFWVGDTATWNRPTFPVAGRHQTLNFYTKFFQADRDSMVLTLVLFKGDSGVAYSNYIMDSTVSDYIPVSLDIQYYTNLIPDSGAISVSVNGNSSTGGSTLYLDDFSFDGFRISDIQNIKSMPSELSIYPNPANDILILQTNLSGRSDYEIYDMRGNKIYANNFNGIKTTLNIGGWADGIYVVRVKNADKVISQKLMISK